MYLEGCTCCFKEVYFKEVWIDSFLFLKKYLYTITMYNTFDYLWRMAGLN